MNPSDSKPDPKRLVDEYFLRDFTQREVDELNAALAMNPALKEEFIQSVHDDLDLYDAIQHVQEEQLLRERTVVYTQRRSAHAIRMARMNRIAAALLILLSVGGLVYRMANPPPAPVLVDNPPTLVSTPEIEIEKEVVLPQTPVPEAPVLKKEIRIVAEITDLYVLDGNQISVNNATETRQLHAGEFIGIGDALSVPSGGRLSMKYLSDSTTVSFEENSSFEILESNGAKHLELHAGRMVADVAKQKPGKPFRITTDDAELVVLGTRFELLNRKETILSVHSGNVQMNDLSNDDSVSVPAGYFAASDKGKFSKPIAFLHEKLKPVYSRTLPDIPRNHKKAAKTQIVVDSERNLRGRLDFKIPRVKGRIVRAELRLRVVPFETDRRGGGTVRVKRAERKNAPDMGVHSGEVKAGMDLIFSIDPSQLSEGKNKLLLEMDKGGNDFWFGAEDSKTPPELHLTIIKN